MYQIDFDISRKIIKDCDEKITEINNEIINRNNKNNKKKLGGKLQFPITDYEIIYF